MNIIEESELILNPDGSIYHLKLKPENIGDTVILVGDQGRVSHVSKYFETIEHKSQNREFCAHTGYYKGVKITALSTGIGADNIDIVVSELDALANIDLTSRINKKEHRRLNLIRIGTSGAIQPGIDVDTYLASFYGLGLDSLLYFYKYDPGLLETDIIEAFIEQTGWPVKLPYPYIVKNNGALIDKIGYDMNHGITVTAPGFFGPQGRELRIGLAYPWLNKKMEQFEFNDQTITNYEMETSALYALGKILGHNTLTICTIIANRYTKKFSPDYSKSIDKLIRLVLDRIACL